MGKRSITMNRLVILSVLVASAFAAPGAKLPPEPYNQLAETGTRYTKRSVAKTESGLVGAYAAGHQTEKRSAGAEPEDIQDFYGSLYALPYYRPYIHAETVKRSAGAEPE